MFSADELSRIDDLTPEQIVAGIYERYPRLTPAEEKARLELGLTVPQAIVYFAPEQYSYRTVMAGRRFGKSFLLLYELIRAAQVAPKSKCAYVGPQLKQSKRIFWRLLLNSIPPKMIAYKNETNLEIILEGFESSIQLFGADGENAEAMRGIPLDFVGIDECKDIASHVFPEIIEPTLADSDRGDALFIGTPSDGGTWFEDMYNDGLSGEFPYIKSFHFSTLEGGNVSLEKVKRAARRLSKEQWEREYNALITQSVGAVYTSFDRYKNVSEIAQDNGTELLVGIDFNVSPMSCVIGTDAGGGYLHIWDEIEIMGGTTDALAQEIKRRYPGRTVIAYPDPSGRQRRTVSENTDFYILSQEGFRVLAPLKAPPVKDRVNSVQAMLCSAAGERKLLINPRCRSTIKCLTKQKYNDSRQPDKKAGYDHLPDALGYLISKEFPLIKRRLGMGKLIGA